MKRKSAIRVVILIMCIGFAAISTTLFINGNTKVSENAADFSVIFTAATLDGIDVYNDVIDDTKKIITFETNDLKTLNQTSVLNYEVTNNSSNYDAEVQVNCKVKDNAEAKYTSIKNELKGNATVIKAKETLNGTLTVTLNKTATEEVKENYVCTLEFNAVERDTIAVSGTNLYNIIKDNADTTTVIDYKIRSGASGTNGIYMTTQTEDNVPVYYFRGDADKVNNNIIFNNMCWKIIRTTETGGIKIIYNGTPTDGKCETQTGETTQIGTNPWNTKSDDAAYVGYMFGINNAGSSKSKEEAQTNSSESSLKTYLENWFKNNLLNYNDYLEDTIFCNDRSTVAFDSNKIGNDYYSSYGSLGYGNNNILYGVTYRAWIYSKTPNPSLTCKNQNDKFTVDSKNGNGMLKYPVGLITSDEGILSGFNTYSSNESDYLDISNYLYTGISFWTFSAVGMNINSSAAVGNIGDDGGIHGSYVFDSIGVRPVVSLKKGTFVTGSGTTTNPYIVKY